MEIKHTQISVTVRNRDTLVKAINEVIEEASGEPYQYDEFNKEKYFMRLSRNDCGCVHTYRKIEDIPSSSLFCEHGNQIIRYTDEELLN